VDTLDNCPEIPNQAQHDTDLDGLGDVCEVIVSDSVALTFDNQPSGVDFDAVRDGDGHIRGFVMASDVDGAGNVIANGQLLHIYETSVGSPLIAESLLTSADGFVPNSLATAVNRDGDVCLSYQLVNGASPLHVGCIVGGVLETEEVSGHNLNTAGAYRLVYDADNLPHVFFYQHGLVNGVNHRIRHVWSDGNAWSKEVVPMPAELLPPAVHDPASTFSCVAFDEDQGIHVVLSGFPDVACNTGPPCFDYDADLVYARLDSSGSWSSEVARLDLDEGTPSPETNLTGCALGVDSNGDLDLLYTLGTGARAHSRLEGGVWTHTDLEPGENIQRLVYDAEDRVYATGGLYDFELVRVLEAPYTSVLSSDTTSYGSFVFPYASDAGTDCVILTAQVVALYPAESQVEIARTEIAGCSIPFEELPRPDYALP